MKQTLYLNDTCYDMSNKSDLASIGKVKLIIGNFSNKITKLIESYKSRHAEKYQLNLTSEHAYQKLGG